MAHLDWQLYETYSRIDVDNEVFMGYYMTYEDIRCLIEDCSEPIPMLEADCVVSVEHLYDIQLERVDYQYYRIIDEYSDYMSEQR